MTESTLKKIQELASKHEVYGDLFVKGAEALHKIYVEMADDTEKFRELVGLSLGEASVCWDDKGIFMSERVLQISENIVSEHAQSSAQISALKEEIERLKKEVLHLKIVGWFAVCGAYEARGGGKAPESHDWAACYRIFSVDEPIPFNSTVPSEQVTYEGYLARRLKEQLNGKDTSR